MATTTKYQFNRAGEFTYEVVLEGCDIGTVTKVNKLVFYLDRGELWRVRGGFASGGTEWDARDVHGDLINHAGLGYKTRKAAAWGCEYAWRKAKGEM